MKEKGKQIRKAGRPPKEESQKKSRIISIRLSESEYTTVKNYAKQLGISFSAYCGYALLKAKVKTIKAMKPEDLKLLRSLEGEANNLNQLARRAHVNGMFSVAIEILKVLEQFKVVIGKLSDDWKSYKRKKF